MNTTPQDLSVELIDRDPCSRRCFFAHAHASADRPVLYLIANRPVAPITSLLPGWARAIGGRSRTVRKTSEAGTRRAAAECKYAKLLAVSR
jgi:hypothetical protein